MRWIRLLSAFTRAGFRTRLRINDQSIVRFHVWITDIDVSIMNHAAIMTVMEMGRVDFIVRSGFLKLARKKKWYFPSASISAQFLRPLKVFQKASVLTRIFHVDDRWIYLEQKVERAGKVMAICIVKSTVKKGRDHVSTKEIIKELRIGELPFEGKELVDLYEQENKIVYQRLVSQ
ncbi:MAG TPA: acyl-CoA thioesterase [Chitinophagaceae bacterium]|nr:acyl-CoA thioesterase [Chitinophagaceae bacterium]